MNCNNQKPCQKGQKNSRSSPCEKKKGIKCNDGCPSGKVHKPVIYIYPKSEEPFKVKLDINGEFLCTYPFSSIGEWEGTARLDGSLNINGAEFPYIFWEANLKLPSEIQEGFCVPRSEIVPFLEQKLTLLGLNDSERTAFITYWLRDMMSAPYCIISFGTDEYEKAAQLHVQSASKIIRVFMSFRLSNEKVEITEEKLQPADRSCDGTHVVEWGGRKL